MIDERMPSTSSQTPDQAMRAQMLHELNEAAAAAWRECVEECAHGYITYSPIYDGDGDRLDFLGYRWYYRLGNRDHYAYNYIHSVVRHVAKRLYRRHHFRQRPDAAKWRKWLVDTARTISWRYALGTTQDVARRMSELFGARYGLDFSYHLYDGRAVFVLSDGEDLGADWEVLADLHVRGHWVGDFDYLRVLYAYNPTKRLLLCIHQTYVGIPSGGWALEWVLKHEWWNITPEEAKEIASEVLRDKDVDKIEE